MKKRKINSVAFPCTRALETHTTARQSDEHYSKVGLDTGPVAWEKNYLNSEGKGVQTTVCNCQRGNNPWGFLFGLVCHFRFSLPVREYEKEGLRAVPVLRGLYTRTT